MLTVKEEETGTVIYIPVEVTNGEVVPNIKTGNGFTISLKQDGTVWGFGNNRLGELGLGNNVNRNAPKKVEIDTGTKANTSTETENPGAEAPVEKTIVTQIAVGTSHVLALTDTGKIYAWGLNNKGQLGDGSTANSNIPRQVKMLEVEVKPGQISGRIVKIIASKCSSYAITQNGKVYAWGEGYEKAPKEITFASEEKVLDIIDISASYVLDREGNIYNKNTMVRIPVVEGIKYITEGQDHTVFLSKNNTAYAIGSNTFGQFGDGANVSSEDSVMAVMNEGKTDVLRNIEKIEAGDRYTTIKLEDGRILSAGINEHGILAVDGIDESYLVVANSKVQKLCTDKRESIMLLDAGYTHVSIALTNGEVYTWGNNAYGQFGNGKNQASVEPQKAGKDIIVSSTNNILIHENETVEINAGISYFNLLEEKQGTIEYESKDETKITATPAGTVENGNTKANVKGIKQGKASIVIKEIGTNNISVVQVRVLPEGINIEPQVETNGSNTITLKANGEVWCYGRNENGELGNGTTEYSDMPVKAIFPEGVMIKQIASGENFAAALDTEGNVWVWGKNDYGQLGNNSTNGTTTPTKVAGLSNITKIACGAYNMLAVSEDKQVYGWGQNANGELGIGSYTNKVLTPTKAKNVIDAIDIALGKNHSILIKTTGEIYATGLNIYGQLGNNDKTIKKVNEFTKVENLNNVVRISTTDSGNLAVTTDRKCILMGTKCIWSIRTRRQNNKIRTNRSTRNDKHNRRRWRKNTLYPIKQGRKSILIRIK